MVPDHANLEEPTGVSLRSPQFIFEGPGREFRNLQSANVLVERFNLLAQNAFMLKAALFLSALLAPCAVAAPSLSGTVQDSSKARIEGAKVTLWDAATGKGLQILASRGDFSFPNVAEGDYLFKVESDGRMPVYGALHLMADGDHEINVVMLSSVQGNADAVGAGAALRDTVGPPQDPAKPPKVKFPKLKKKGKTDLSRGSSQSWS